MEQYDKLSVYIPKQKQVLKIVQRLEKIGARTDRAVNYLVVAAIEEYLERHEGKK